ncbi:hypothetical protein AB9T88_09905, partial [Flavobacterium sp. LBUM151]
MKSKYVILASALLISVATFAQKDQIKSAEKALKSGDAQGAITILKDAENMVVNAKDVEQAQYYFVQGNAYLDLANKKVEESKNLSAAAQSYNKLIEVEKASGKQKYSTQAAASITQIKGLLINSAIADTQANKNAEGSKKLYEAYLLDRKDTINLYYAASTAVNGQDFDTALPMYEEFKKINYSGKGTSYTAVNKASGSEDGFNTASERDLAVKLGTHEKPKTEA